MAFPGTSEVDLLLALQQGAVGEAGWREFLSRLAAMTGADFAALVERIPGSDQPPDIVTATPSGSPIAHAESVGILLNDRVRPERIYTEGDLIELANVEERHAWQAALDALSMASIRIMRIAVPDTASMVLGIFGMRGFDAADSAVLRRLFPYLQAAARIAARIRRNRFRAAITAGCARKTCFGWFLLDCAGVIMETSAAAGDLPCGIRILPGPQGDRLGFAERSAEPALAAILHRFATDPLTRDHAVRVSHDPLLHLRVGPPPPEALARSGKPVALATLHGEVRLAAGTEALLVDLFGLLPSEARLAAAIADGNSLAEAAEALGLTIETTRNYSKRIFAKTGAQGQADLVRLIFANGFAETPG